MAIKRTKSKNTNKSKGESSHDRPLKKQKRVKQSSKSDEEIESDDEAVLTPPESETEDNAGKEAPAKAESALSAEERRLLLAQDCLKRMGMAHGSAEVDEVVKSLIPDEAELSKVKTRALAESISFAAPIIYPATSHIATCIDVDPSTRTIAYTGGKDCRILRWDLATGQSTPFPGKAGDSDCGGHFAPINAIAMGWNGRLLVSGGQDELLRIWDTRQAGSKCIAELRGHQKAITAIRISGDNIYTASDDKALRVWSLVAQKCMETEYGHTSRITALEVGEKGMVLSAGQDATCRYWNIENQKHSILADPSAEGFDSIHLLNRYGFVAGDQRGRISLWSLSKRKPLQHCCLNKSTKSIGWVSALTGLPGTDCVISGSDTGELEIWKATLGEDGGLTRQNGIKMAGVVNDLRFTCDGSALLAATAKEGRFGRWVLSKDRPVGIAVIPIEGMGWVC